MGFYAEPWLREARDHIKTMPNRSVDAPPSAGDFDKLADAVEKAIKAALVENSGTIPSQLENLNLVSVCQATGVWDILPPALKGLVQEVTTLRAANPTTTAAVKGESTSAQLQRYFQVARGLIDYMEFHVIGNDSVLKRLRVA
jgi:hypothetical protein